MFSSMRQKLVADARHENESSTRTNMKTAFDRSTLRKNSPLFWCTLVVPAAMIVVGINFILNPVGASTGYGIRIHDAGVVAVLLLRAPTT